MKVLFSSIQSLFFSIFHNGIKMSGSFNGGTYIAVFIRIVEASPFDESTFKRYSKPYFSFFHNGIKMSGSIAASGFVFLER